MGLSTLTKTGKSSYTIDMTTKKTFLAIIFGLIFTLAGSRAFAGQDAYKQLVDATKAGAVTGDISVVQKSTSAVLNGTKAGRNLLGTIKNALTGNTNKPRANATFTVPAPPPPPPAPSRIPQLLSAYSPHIIMGGLGAYLGFVLLGGPLGIALGALFMVGLIVLSDMK